MSSKKNISTKFKIAVVLFVSFLGSINTYAQCAMCRASLESSGENQKAEAVNDGIVYLMAIPYLLMALIGVVIYKMYYGKKAK